jgi:SAM-dependent methyltransferase
MSDPAVESWDAAASTFDDQPDHGLTDPGVRAAWAALLDRLIPPYYARVADLGCGTGSLSLLLSEAGRLVTGMDSSPAMVDRAEAKAREARLVVDFRRGDVATPQLAPASYDAVLARHVVWALPDPARNLRTWVSLLVPGGRLVLVEGSWSTGAGLRAAELSALLAEDPRLSSPIVETLADPALWGGPVDDERYAITCNVLSGNGKMLWDNGTGTA